MTAIEKLSAFKAKTEDKIESHKDFYGLIDKNDRSVQKHSYERDNSSGPRRTLHTGCCTLSMGTQIDGAVISIIDGTRSRAEVFPITVSQSV